MSTLSDQLWLFHFEEISLYFSNFNQNCFGLKKNGFRGLLYFSLKLVWIFPTLINIVTGFCCLLFCICHICKYNWNYLNITWHGPHFYDSIQFVLANLSWLLSRVWRDNSYTSIRYRFAWYSHNNIIIQVASQSQLFAFNNSIWGVERYTVIKIMGFVLLDL